VVVGKEGAASHEVIWKMNWDTEEDAKEFLEAYSAGLAGKEGASQRQLLTGKWVQLTPRREIKIELDRQVVQVRVRIRSN